MSDHRVITGDSVEVQDAYVNNISIGCVLEKEYAGGRWNY